MKKRCFSVINKSPKIYLFKNINDKKEKIYIIRFTPTGEYHLFHRVLPCILSFQYKLMAFEMAKHFSGCEVLLRDWCEEVYRGAYSGEGIFNNHVLSHGLIRAHVKSLTGMILPE